MASEAAFEAEDLVEAVAVSVVEEVAASVIEVGMVEVAEGSDIMVEALVLPRAHLQVHVVLEEAALVVVVEGLVDRLTGDRTAMGDVSTTKQV